MEILGKFLGKILGKILGLKLAIPLILIFLSGWIIDRLIAEDSKKMTPAIAIQVGAILWYALGVAVADQWNFFAVAEIIIVLIGSAWLASLNIVPVIFMTVYQTATFFILLSRFLSLKDFTQDFNDLSSLNASSFDIGSGLVIGMVIKILAVIFMFIGLRK